MMPKKKKRKSDTVKVEMKVLERLDDYVSKTGVNLKFFTTKAIEEKLDRELVKEVAR
jgi:hypothetical protein